jgi:hypothetical protein
MTTPGANLSRAELLLKNNVQCSGAARRQAASIGSRQMPENPAWLGDGQ